MFMIISMTISLPRQLALDVSPCHTGANIVSLGHLTMQLRLTSRRVDTVPNAGDDSVEVSE
jgi:hypothetical protein